MKCEDFMSLIDAYVDQELTGAQLPEMHEHAQGCEACRREMENADLLKNYLSEMDRQVCVPLPAQAAWRNAVKAEAVSYTHLDVYKRQGLLRRPVGNPVGRSKALRKSPHLLCGPFRKALVCKKRPFGSGKALIGAKMSAPWKQFASGERFSSIFPPARPWRSLPGSESLPA